MIRNDRIAVISLGVNPDYVERDLNCLYRSGYKLLTTYQAVDSQGRIEGAYAVLCSKRT